MAQVHSTKCNQPVHDTGWRVGQPNQINQRKMALHQTNRVMTTGRIEEDRSRQIYIVDVHGLGVLGK